MLISQFYWHETLEVSAQHYEQEDHSDQSYRTNRCSKETERFKVVRNLDLSSTVHLVQFISCFVQLKHDWSARYLQLEFVWIISVLRGFNHNLFFFNLENIVERRCTCWYRSECVNLFDRELCWCKITMCWNRNMKEVVALIFRRKLSQHSIAQSLKFWWRFWYEIISDWNTVASELSFLCSHQTWSHEADCLQPREVLNAVVILREGQISLVKQVCQNNKTIYVLLIIVVECCIWMNHWDPHHWFYMSLIVAWHSKR